MSNTPETAVQEFVDAWGEQDFRKLRSCVQTSWRMSANSAAERERQMLPEDYPEMPKWVHQGEDNKGYTALERLRVWFGDESLEMAEVSGEAEPSGIEHLGDVMMDVPVQIVLKDRFGQRKAETRIARVVCENELGEPTTDGTWGVNPVSIMRRG